MNRMLNKNNKNNKKNKNQLLQLMGITVWQLREQTLFVPRYFSYQLNNAAGKPMGLLIADAVDDNPMSLAEQENLVQKIIEALTPHFIALSMPQENDSYAFVILLGHNAKTMLQNSGITANRLIFHDAPVDLIQHIERKKELWSEIKSLRDLFIL